MSLPNEFSQARARGVAGDILAAAAHELKNPLEAMTSLLYLLHRNKTLDDAGQRYVGLLGEELERMRVVAAQTLGLYRESARPKTVNLSEVLDAIVSFYDPKIHHKQIMVQKRYGHSNLIEAVPGEIRQVFTNLVVNAFEAVPPGGTVVLHTSNWRKSGEPTCEGVRVTVADNGPGIQPDDRQRMFAPFFTTKGEKGNGLGLWVTKGLVDKYGGSIRVRSSAQPGRSGTAFSVFLPVNRNINESIAEAHYNDRGAEHRAPSVEEAGAQLASPNNSGIIAMANFHYRILVVDDDEMIRRVSEELLSQASYEVRTAQDGFEALATMRKALPDLIISDLKMPNMSGFEFLSVVRRRFPQIPVIAITGEFVNTGNPAGMLADTLFHKGQYHPEQLFKKIQSMLEDAPIRPYFAKAEKVPVWIPRNGNYVVLTCPDCLRSFSITDEEAKVSSGVPCLFCNTAIHFILDSGQES